MIRKITYYFLLSFFLQISCTREKQKQDSFNFIPPEITEAKSYIVPQDKILPPEIIPAKEIKGKAISKPETINLKSNVYAAGKPKVVIAGVPKICVPGQNGFALPEIVPAIDSPFAAGLPEVVMVKDLQIKDNNPASFSHFKPLQGLRSDMIFPIIKDRKGNIWIGGYEGGVSKYDGRYFSNYTTTQGLCSDNIWSMMEDSKGNLWFSSFDGKGLSKFDGKSFTRYTTQPGLSGNTVASMFEDRKGDLWFGTDTGGVIQYDGKTFTHYTVAQGLAGNGVHCIMEDSKGILWFGTNNGISRFDGTSFSNFTTEQGLGNALIMDILEDNRGKIWICTNGGGVNVLKGNVFEHYSIEQGLASNVVTTVIEDAKGNLWFGTLGKGIFKYDGRSFIQFTTAQGLSYDNVWHIAEDKNGTLWIGTTSGLCKYDGETFTHFDPSQGFSKGGFHCIREDKNGAIWSGIYDGGVNKYDGKVVTKYGVAQGLKDSSVECLLKDSKGNLWVGTQKSGLYKYDNNCFVQFENSLLKKSVWSILEDRRGNIWFGTSDGVNVYDGKNFIHYGLPQGMGSTSIASICEDKKGNLWFGADEDGIITKFDPAAAASGRNSFTHYKLNRGLGISFTFSILSDKKNNVWFSTNDAGVIKFDGRFFTRYTTAQGLSSNYVCSIVEDKDDNIWFLTNSGLCKMRSPISVATEKINRDHAEISLFTRYFFSDGFLGVGGHYNSMTLDHNGNIWIGTINRLTRYHPEGDRPDSIPPTIELSGISLFDQNIKWQDFEKKKDTGLLLNNGIRLHDIKFKELSKWYYVPQELKLAYDNNYVKFQFIGITTKKPAQVKYQYKLDGLDDKWSSLTSQPEASYSNLPSGEFTFKVKAVNSEGYWSKELSYPFRIFPPWWKTWWAYTLYVLTAVLILYGTIRWRLQQKFRTQLEKSEKETEIAEIKQKATELEMQALRAQMNPHFIFNSLNSINRFILKNDRLLASEYLTKFSKLVRMILQNSQHALISLESELESLEIYMNLEAVRFDHHFEYKISVPKDMDVEVLKVPPLFIQPYVENAIWHGLMHKEEKGKLDIEVSQEEDFLYFKIADNGIGRKKAAEIAGKSTTKHKSMGLKITANRIAMMQQSNGEESPVHINDLVNPDGTAAGTEVVIKMPVIEEV